MMPRSMFPVGHGAGRTGIARRRLFRAAWLAACLPVLVPILATFPARAQQRDLTVVSWGGAYQDAQREVYFRPFQTKTNTRLLEESWDGGVGVLRAKIQSGANNWDCLLYTSPSPRDRG